MGRTLPLLLLALLWLSACGKKGGATSLEVTVAALNTPATGEVFLMAHNPSTGLFRRQHLVSDPQSLEIPNGTWNFYLVFFDGGLTGTPRCGSRLSEKLEGQAIGLSFTVKAADCLVAPFTDPTFVDTAPQVMRFQTCATAIPSMGTNCSTDMGMTQSYQFLIPDVTFSPITGPTLTSTGYVTACSSTITTAGTLTNFRLLAGSSAMPFPFAIRSFTAPGCSGTSRDFAFPKGLLTTNTSTVAVHDYTPGAPDQTWLYFKHDSSSGLLNAAINNFFIPSESTYPMDTSKFITGGVAPLVYSCVSCGSGSVNSSTGVFTNDNVGATARVVRVTDATGRFIDLTMTTVASVLHDFTSYAFSTWNATRSSSGLDVTMMSPGMFSTATTNTPRFLTPRSTFSAGILVEPPRTNLVTSHNVLSSWNTVSGTVSYSLSGSSPYSGTQPSLLGDPSTGFASYRQSPQYTAISGDYVFSIYLKAGSSNIVNVHFEDTVSSCNGLIVDLSDGSSMASTMCSAQAAGVIPIGGGWYRVWLRETIAGSGANIQFYPAWNTSLSTSSSITATGDVYAWGAQLEAGTYPTTPILTTAGTSGRNSEALNTTTGIIPTTTTGATVLLNWNSLGDSVTASTLLNTYATGSPSTSGMKLHKNASNQLQFTLVAPTSSTLTSTATLNSTTGQNIAAISYGSGKMSLVVNSATNLHTQTISSTPTTTFNTMYLGSTDGSTELSGMVVHKIRRWDQGFLPEVTQQLVGP